jgi:hypothetical protein
MLMMMIHLLIKRLTKWSGIRFFQAHFTEKTQLKVNNLCNDLTTYAIRLVLNLRLVFRIKAPNCFRIFCSSLAHSFLYVKVVFLDPENVGLETKILDVGQGSIQEIIWRGRGVCRSIGSLDGRFKFFQGGKCSTFCGEGRG